MIFVSLLFLTLIFVKEAQLDCVNGDISLNNKTCDCFQGWTGEECDRCGGRIRIHGSGVITDDANSSLYSGDTQCMFFIEADKPASKVHLRFRLLHTECQWDYVHVFDGDSVFTQKLASYTGNIKPRKDPDTTLRNDSSLILSQKMFNIVLSSTGSHVLVYFYSDAAVEADGFEIDYWVDYTCPSNCSGQGECLDNGTCKCDDGWYGELCDLPACPNNCSSSGDCDLDSLSCSCLSNFGGLDCSVDLRKPFWSRVTYSKLPENITITTLARASHSSVLVRGDSMLIYGGYQFSEDGYSALRPLEQEGYGIFDDDSVSNNTVQVLKYHIESGVWESVITSGNISSNFSAALIPSPRYGHTALIYNDTMYVYGGAKLPSEEVVDELWALDLVTHEWTPHFNISEVPVDENTTTLMDELDTVIPQPKRSSLPIPVRSHTAHVVDSKMVVLFGLSSSTEVFVSYVQEYNFDTREWSAPPQKGFPVSGRMGHASAYSPNTGLIYVEGGVILIGDDEEITSQLLVYDPVSYVWNSLSASGHRHYLHSMILFGPLLLVFGGCQGSDGDCYTNSLTVYNTHCDSWEVVRYPGLPLNSSRYSHVANLHEDSDSLLIFGGFIGSLHHDMLQLHFTNCSIYSSQNACLQNSTFCAWSGGDQGRCVSVSEIKGDENITFGCATDMCGQNHDCRECNKYSNCSWNNELFFCTVSNSSGGDCSKQETDDLCSGYRHCESCSVHDCQWNGSHCYSPSRFKELNLTEVVCPSISCLVITSCKECTRSSGCLWCPSLNHCVPSGVYPFYYIHGQCLGWVSHGYDCTGGCGEYKTCGDCQSDPRCGWCNDASDTGLGECSEGGFNGPRNVSYCRHDSELVYERWFFDACPDCQCNGHSSCVNASICESCQNNTDGNNCEKCANGYWGDPRNGGTCQGCDCNGYNSECNTSTGVCECLSFGVTGDHCRQCDAVSSGNASNFCFSEMKVNFIYTYSVEMDREKEGFFAVTPPEDKDLNFKFEITSNPNNQAINLQFFLGRRSQDLWVLANLSLPVVLDNLETHMQSFDDFTSNSNVSLAQLYSFARPTILELSNFTELFYDSVESDYTKSMWDDDVTLVIYLSNLSRPMTFKITVDQQDFLFLLYFFITFITCFSVLLTAFLLGWYIKQKIMMRNLLRQQYIELQRRVARPFARIKLYVDKFNPKTTDPVESQDASYIGVETLRDSKAAILSLFIRLPGDEDTGLPVLGRSGICVGSTLVKVNPSKKVTESSQIKRRKKEMKYGEQTVPIARVNNSIVV